MKYTITKEEKYTLIVPREERLNSLKAPDLKTELVALFQTGTVNLIMDLQMVKHIDSSGLNAVLLANRLAKDADGQFVLTGLKSKYVVGLIKASKLDQVFNILPTAEEAVDAIFLGEIEKDLKREGH